MLMQVFSGYRIGAMGAVIRDSGGNFIAASCDYKEHAIDASTMEAMALLSGLRLAEGIGCHSIIVESDSMEVVDAMTNPFDYRGTGAVIIDNCQELLLTLGKATLHQYPREANKAVHELARQGATQGTGGVV
jgi:ribonuclease HI